MKKFNLNGVNVELSKEKLREMLKEYDEPKGEISAEKDNSINLYKSERYETMLLYPDSENGGNNLSTISRNMARAMSDLMETEDVLDRNIDGYKVLYNTHTNMWQCSYTSAFADEKHFKTAKTAKLAAELLNKSKDMKEGLRRVCG